MICFIEKYKTSSSLISNTVTTISPPSHGSTLRLENSYKSPNARVKKRTLRNKRNQKCNFLGISTGLYIHKHNPMSKLWISTKYLSNFLHNEVIYGKGSDAYITEKLLNKN
jgi:hypothetical protein